MLSDRGPRWLRPGPVIIALLVWLAVAGVAGPVVGQISSVQRNDQALFVPSSAESTRANALAAEFETDQTVPALVVLTTSDGAPVSQPQRTAVTDWAAGFGAGELPGGSGTWSSRLTGDPVVTVSQDSLALLVVVPLDASVADQQLDGERTSVALVDALRASLAADLGARADSAGSAGLHAWVTGPAGFVADLVSAFAGIDGVLLLVALGAVLIILVVVYRSPFLPLVVIVTAVFALALAGFVVYHLADAGVITLNGQAQGILAILVVGASVDYSLLVVARYREELHRHREPAAALAAALRRAVEPIAASAGTVIAGVLCLLLSDLGSNRALGPVAALGIAASFVAATTLLPALLLIAGRRSRVLFWPRVPRPEAEPAQAGATAAGLWGRVAAFVVGHARVVWPATAVLLIGLGAFATTLDASGTSQSEVFLTKVDAVGGETVLAEHFPAGAVQPVYVVVGQDQAQAALTAATGVPGVESAAVYTGTPAGVPSSGRPAVVVDGRVRIDVVTQAASDSSQASTTVADLRTAVHAAAPGALVGGTAATSLDTELAAQRDLRVVVPAVLAVIVVILMLLLRSVVAAGVLLVANVLSFGAAIGVSALVFQHVAGWPRVDPTVPLYGFVFLVALGVDYSIFLMTRVREETAAHGTTQGVRAGLAVTGTVITSAGLVLAATFAALAVIPLLFLAQLAFVVAFGVLLDTFLVRSALVPAVVVALGRHAWWPSRLSRPS